MKRFETKKWSLYALVTMSMSWNMLQDVHGQVFFDPVKGPVQQAITHNKSLQNANLENKKVELERGIVKGKFLPKVSANAAYGYLNSTTDIDLPTQQLPIPIDGLELFSGSQELNLSTQMAMAGVSVTQVIFSGLQITNGQKALEQKYKAQQLMTEASHDQIAQDVILSFDQLMFLKQVDLLIADSEKRLNKEHEKVVKAISNGLAIPYDRDKIKLAMLELDSKKAEIQSNRELLYYKLQELTGMSIEDLQAISYDLSEMFLADGQINTMERKELEALEASQKAYDYALKKEKGAHLPMLFAFGNVSYFNAFNSTIKLKDLPVLGDLNLGTNHIRLAPNYLVGVGMKWNIFEGKETKNKIEQAKLDVQINANKLEDTKEKLTLLQRKTIADYNVSLKRVPVSEQQMAIAKNNLHLASRQFEEGLVDVTERLAAENEFYKQSMNYFNQLLMQRASAVEVLKTNGLLYQTVNQ